MDIICIFSHRMTLHLSFTTKKHITEISQPPLQNHRVRYSVRSELCLTLKHNHGVREYIQMALLVCKWCTRWYTRPLAHVQTHVLRIHHFNNLYYICYLKITPIYDVCTGSNNEHLLYTFPTEISCNVIALLINHTLETYRVAQKKTIPKLTKMLGTNDIFGTNYNA